MISDRITLRGLEVFAHHGVQAEERQIGQRFIVDLDLLLDLAQAGATDDLADTVDYGTLAERVVAIVAEERWNLIERVAQRVADTAFEFVAVREVVVTVHKPEAPLLLAFGDVAVTIHRGRNA